MESRPSSRVPRHRLVAVGVALLLGTSSVAALALTGEVASSPADCEGDHPEPSHQGDVPPGSSPAWDCGVDILGAVPGVSGAMAAASHCAYLGDRSAGLVWIVDVSDPAAPRKIEEPMQTSSRELLAAIDTRAPGDADGRALLATRRRLTEPRAGQIRGRDVEVDIWDISQDCTKPEKLGHVTFPTASDSVGDPDELGSPAHNLKFSRDGTRLYGSIPTTEVDLSDLSDPATWTRRELHCEVANQGYEPYQVPNDLGLDVCATYRDQAAHTPGRWPQMDHEPTFSPDGTTLYLGAQIPGYRTNSMWVVDMTTDDPQLLSVTENAPGHGIEYATIGGRSYLLHANEIGGTPCIPKQVRPNHLGMADRIFLLDVTDPRAPQRAGEIILADSEFENCGHDQASGGPSTAYHAVDDITDTRYGVLGFGSAGWRIFDLRDIDSITEVAYFNHGDAAHTRPHIDPETGHIWLSSGDTFYVLDLEDQVKAQLGLSEGCPGRSGDRTADRPACGKGQPR